MSLTGVADNPELIPQVWSPLIYQELRSTVAWLNLFSKDYQGAITEKGDSVTVNSILAPEAEDMTNDKDTFQSQPLNTDNFKIEANRRAVAAFEITDLKKLQSIEFQAEVIAALNYSIRKKIDDYLLSIMAANLRNDLTFNPNGARLAAQDITDALAQMSDIGKVPKDGNLFGGHGALYYGHLTSDEKTISSDYDPNDVNSIIAGEVNRLGGAMHFENNNQGSKVSWLAHRSAVQLVMQTQVNVKVSDLHPQNKFGYLVSADVVYGAEVGDAKRYSKIEEA